MIPRLKPSLGLSEVFAALRISFSNDIVEFENAFAKKFNAQYAIAFPYGRTALKFLIDCLEVKGAEIVTPAYTCVVVQHAVKFSGNQPVFLDSSSDSFNMNLKNCTSPLINSKTKALIATSIFGYPIDLRDLDEVKNKFGSQIIIIQDCAHSFSATFDGTEVQTQGVAAIYGLNISKLMTSIFGGMITTNDSSLANRLRAQRGQEISKPSLLKSLSRFLYLIVVFPTFYEPIYGFINWLERKGILNRFVKYYDEGKIDMPSDYLTGMTPLEARVGLANLKKFDSILRRRRINAEYYFSNLAGIDGIALPPRVEGATYSHFVLLVKDRTWWLKKCLESNIQLGKLIEYSIPEMTSYGAAARAQFPNSGYYSDHTINLPIHSGLDVAVRTVALIKKLAPLAPK